MSYQGWRRGSPYERPSNNGPNQRRGKPRPAFNTPLPPQQQRPPISQTTPSPAKHFDNSKANTPKLGTPSPVPGIKSNLTTPPVDPKGKPEEKTATEKTPKTVALLDSRKPTVAGATVTVMADTAKSTKTLSTGSIPAPSKPVDDSNNKAKPAEVKDAISVVPKVEREITPTTKPSGNNEKQNNGERPPNKPTSNVRSSGPRVLESGPRVTESGPRDTESVSRGTESRPRISESSPRVNEGNPTPAGFDKIQSDRNRNRPRFSPRVNEQPPGRLQPNAPQLNSGRQGHAFGSQGKRPNTSDDRETPPKRFWQEPEEPEDMERENVPTKLIDIKDLIRPSEKKFSARCRLFVAGLPNGYTEDEFCKLFQTYGETTEAYINKEKNFGFIRLDYRVNSEIARNKLDGSTLKGRRLQVRFASNASAIEVLGLGPFVTDEILEQAFSKFGAVERAIVVCDDRGKSKEYGIVEFSYKKATQKAIQAVNQGLFVLGRHPKPVSARLLVTVDEESGVKEADVERKQGYGEEREFGPRFVGPGTFEYELAQKWKGLEDTEKARKLEVENEMKLAREALENDMANAMHRREEELMRQELMKKEEELRQIEELKQMEHMRLQEQLRRLEQKRLDEEQRRQEDLTRKQNEFRAQGELRKLQEIQRQEDIRRQAADIGRRADSIRSQDERRRTGDMRPRDMNRGRHEDEHVRPEDDSRLQTQGAMRADLGRMDAVKRKDAYGDDKLDLGRGRPQQDFPGMMATDYRGNSQTGPDSTSNANATSQQLDSLRGYTTGQIPFPRGLDIPRQGYSSTGGAQGYDSPGRLPYGDQNMMAGVSPGDIPGQGIGGGMMSTQPRLPPPPALPGGLTRPLMDDSGRGGDFPPRFEPRFGDKRKRIL